MVKLSTMLLFVLLLFVMTALSQDTKEQAQKAIDYKAQLQSLEQETQLQIKTLSEQLESAELKDRETLDKQIIDIKHNAEIQRLTILLDWAKAEGDQARIAEVQKALDNWVNPPQPQQLPTVDRSSDTPGVQTDSNQTPKSSTIGK
jgi:hypothetical protein